jgi:hypothetical protein
VLKSIFMWRHDDFVGMQSTPSVVMYDIIIIQLKLVLAVITSCIIGPRDYTLSIASPLSLKTNFLFFFSVSCGPIMLLLIN